MNIALAVVIIVAVIGQIAYYILDSKDIRRHLSALDEAHVDDMASIAELLEKINEVHKELNEDIDILNRKADLLIDVALHSPCVRDRVAAYSIDWSKMTDENTMKLSHMLQKVYDGRMKMKEAADKCKEEGIPFEIEEEAKSKRK